MVTIEQVKEYTRNQFNEQDVDDRIEDRGFAFYINTQPRQHLDSKEDHAMTLGGGPIVVLKETGEIYSFSSSPVFIGVNRASSPIVSTSNAKASCVR